jgi:hypothetical protein
MLCFQSSWIATLLLEERAEMEIFDQVSDKNAHKWHIFIEFLPVLHFYVLLKLKIYRRLGTGNGDSTSGRLMTASEYR